MSDLIKREDAMKVAMWFGRSEQKYSHSFIKKRVMEIPSVERNGKWILESGKIASFWVCSECDFPATVADEINDIKYFNYCPHCGAKMKGADDEMLR